MKKWLFIFFLLLLFPLLYYFFSPVKVTVLTYHDFVEEETDNSMQISLASFQKEIQLLSKMHYHTLQLKDVECFLKNECKIPKKSVLITMDDGWKSELEIAAPILKEYDMNAVIFYVGENITGENENFISLEDLEVLRTKYPNIEIASHSYALHYEDAYQLSSEEIKKDIEIMKEYVPSLYYAYPYGKYSEEYQKALEEEGYHLAFTFGPSSEHRKIRQDDLPLQVPRLNMSHDMPTWKFILRLLWYR